MSLAHTAIDLAMSVHSHTPSSVRILADDSAVSTTNLRDWISKNVVFLILLLIACAVSLGALKGHHSKVLTVGGLSLFGLAFFALAGSQSAATGVGNWVLSLVGIHV